MIQSLIYYNARRSDPIITSIPKLPAATVGQVVPDCGKEGAAATGVAVGAAVPAQAQLVLAVQDGFLQKPLQQTKSELQLKLLPQVPLQEFGVAPGVPVGVAVGVAVGVSVGVSVGLPDGVAVGVATVSVKEREHAAGLIVGLGLASCAWGWLDGAAGETDVCLN